MVVLLVVGCREQAKHQGEQGRLSRANLSRGSAKEYTQGRQGARQAVAGCVAGLADIRVVVPEQKANAARRDTLAPVVQGANLGNPPRGRLLVVLMEQAIS